MGSYLQLVTKWFEQSEKVSGRQTVSWHSTGVEADSADGSPHHLFLSFARPAPTRGLIFAQMFEMWEESTDFQHIISSPPSTGSWSHKKLKNCNIFIISSHVSKGARNPMTVVQFHWVKLRLGCWNRGSLSHHYRLMSLCVLAHNLIFELATETKYLPKQIQVIKTDCCFCNLRNFTNMKRFNFSGKYFNSVILNSFFKISFC